MNASTDVHALTSPFDRYELRLVRHVLERPGALHPRDEAAIRYALAIARLTAIRGTNGRDIPLTHVTQELRDKLHALLGPAFARNRVDGALIERVSGEVSRVARTTRGRVVVHLGNRVSPQALERELTHRTLVLACGGGGGSGYAHLGAFALLESAGISPGLISGASMGAIIGLFRARATRFDVSQVPQIMGELETRRVFRPFSAENRFCLPAAIRLELRGGIGPYFEMDGVPLRLRDLPIPLLVTVAGVRRGPLPRSLREAPPIHPGAQPPEKTLRELVVNIVRSVGDLVRAPDLLRNIVLGSNDDTREFDVVDAVGYSSAVPGALHYDLARDAPAEVERFEALMEEHEVFRLTDGGVTDNVPAKTAWDSVQSGLIGTRNVFIMGLDGFAPRLTTPLWLPIQQIAHQNVKRSIPYAHLYFPFRRTLSPVELLPRAQNVMRIVESAKKELIEELPFVQRMLEPLPGVAAIQSFERMSG